MRAFVVALFLPMPLSLFAQVVLLSSGSVLTYDVFGAKQGLLQTEVTFQQNKEQRVLKLKIEESGDRIYTFIDGKDFAVYDKFFSRTGNRGRPTSPNEQFLLLPRNQKIELGTQWEFSRAGSGSTCYDWRGTYRSVVKEGADISIDINGKASPIKTFLIEMNGNVLQGNSACTTLTVKRLTWYSPELNEIVMDQMTDTENKTLSGGYKWVLKSITTSADKATKVN